MSAWYTPQVTIIPAAPGTWLREYALDEQGSAYLYTCLPIVAWQVVTNIDADAPRSLPDPVSLYGMRGEVRIPGNAITCSWARRSPVPGKPIAHRSVNV